MNVVIGINSHKWLRRDLERHMVSTESLSVFQQAHNMCSTHTLVPNHDMKVWKVELVI